MEYRANITQLQKKRRIHRGGWSIIILDGAEKGIFGATKNNLYNNMTCRSDSYPITKDKTVGLINNYYIGKQLTWATTVRE